MSPETSESIGIGSSQEGYNGKVLFARPLARSLVSFLLTGRLAPPAFRPSVRPSVYVVLVPINMGMRDCFHAFAVGVFRPKRRKERADKLSHVILLDGCLTLFFSPYIAPIANGWLCRSVRFLPDAFRSISIRSDCAQKMSNYCGSLVVLGASEPRLVGIVAGRPACRQKRKEKAAGFTFIIKAICSHHSTLRQSRLW